MRKASKLSEVAKIAGVSPITASRAIRGVGYVSEAARERIMAAAAQLNYTPDMLARRMRGDKSNLIGVFVNNYGSMVLHEITRMISSEARARGYDILLFNAERFDNPARTGTVEMLSKLCDGLLLVMPNGADRYLESLEQHSVPAVLVNFDARPVRLPVVAIENRMGARAAVEHLLALGHRRIGFIGGTPHTGQSGERELGYKDALHAAGLRVDAALVESGAFAQAPGNAAAQRLLALPRPPTAIFAANDEMAYGAIDAVHSRGLQVPRDVSVIGFDDIPLSSHVFPPLTTMRQPLAALATQAVSDVVALIQGAGVTSARTAFPMELVIRQSTGPAPGAA
ncbi:transcriptional regulator, LacI family [Pseudoduganella flava]|nr:LacI family DNA-binding transcriptional regulator [Pseudoduganella flava]TWI49831.1 transcriptional regulator, LacI family [Pseudoduganella flava]